jgi:hypothetical protein
MVMRTLRLSLVGTVTLVLLGGLGSLAVGQDGSAAPVGLPTGPAAFEVQLGKTADGAYTFTASDPRFSGNLTFDEGIWLEVLPGHQVMADTKRLENEAGAWEGPSSGYIWEDGKNQQTWWVGEGAYAGLNAVTINTTEGLRGVIFEGDIPLWGYCQPPSTQ